MQWETYTIIPEHMVQGISHRDMVEEFDILGNKTDGDDIRLAVELPADHTILLPTNARLIIRNNGDLEIQIMR